MPNSNIYMQMYRKVFFDKGKNKVKGWLLNKKINPSEIDDLVGLMEKVFWENVSKYFHDKIPFEKWIWIKFNQALLNYFYRKTKVYKFSMVQNYDDVLENSDSSNYLYDIGNLSIHEFSQIAIDNDFEKICENLSDLESFIARVKYYNGWNNKEVYNYFRDFGISKKEYLHSCKVIENIFLKYVKGEFH